MSFRNSTSLLQKWLNHFHFAIFIPPTVCRMMAPSDEYATTEEHKMRQLSTHVALFGTSVDYAAPSASGTV